MLVVTAAGCGAKPATTPETPADTSSESAEDVGSASSDFKIGIVTGTVSQGEEEFRTAEAMVAKYGDMIKHVTYPDRFAQEVETTISQIASLGADPDVKAIIIGQEIPGSAAAMDAVRETRPDMLFILGAPHEDPEVVASRADIVLELDQLQRGESVMELAKSMGAETFVHYSFPRHMSYELLSARRDALKATADKIGIEFVEIDAPDPTSEAGVPGSQQFIMEDVPRQVEKYGKDTAFFSTNCAMMEPIIVQSLEHGAIFPEQCCPSPYHGYPGALGIEIPEDKAGDLDFLSAQITEKVAEKGGTGRFATWKRPANVAMIEAGVAYAQAFAKGEVERFDEEAMLGFLKEVTDDTNNEIKFSTLDLEDEIADYKGNFLLFVIGSQLF